MSGRVRVYAACSLDGFLAGPNDEVDWLDEPADVPAADLPLPDALSFESFLAEIGCMLMGRRTCDVVGRLGVPWPYGDLPVLVATGRPLDEVPSTVRAVAGPIGALIDEALDVAGGRDVYLDGGDVIRQALQADRVDELILTWSPTVLGAGRPLFAGVQGTVRLVPTAVTRIGRGMVQIRYVPASRSA
jgi:dihydrofolate reductase